MKENEKLEEMMELENDEIEIIDLEPEEETGSGIGLKLALAGLAGVVVGAIVRKKIKDKKDGKPRKKKRLRWVEVEDDYEDESEDNIIDSEAKEVEETEEE